VGWGPPHLTSRMGMAMKTAKLVILLVVLSLFWGMSVRAWDITELPPGFTVTEPGVPVELEGKILFHVRINTKTETAQQIAYRLSERIKKLAQDPTFDPQSITVQDSALGSDVMAGKQIIVPVYAFTAKIERRQPGEWARELAEKIRQAMAAYKKEHSFRNLIIRIVKTVVALLVTIMLIILVNRGVRRLNRAILASDRIRAIKVGEFEFLTAERIKGVIISAGKIVQLLFILFLVYAYFHLGLSFFPQTQKYALELYESLLQAVGAIGQAVWDQTPAMAFLVVLFLITRYVLKTLYFFFDQVIKGKVTLAGLDAEVAPITYRIIRLLIIAFALVVAYPYIPGSASPAFKGISIFLGVLFSLGSTSAIANLIAGVSLTYTRSFRVGDVIKVGDAMGVVMERKLYITRIRTPKNHIITIPNGTILSTQVTNFSQEVREGEGLILNTSITIGYDAPWERVHALLIEAAHKTKNLFKSPPPFVLQTALNDFYVTYELNAYTDTPEIMPRIYGELHQNIQNAFNEAGVEIMSPHYTQIRDGSHTTIPADYLPADYEAPAIKITNLENIETKESK
jgi:small-conductance mechanosensitive channel